MPLLAQTQLEAAPSRWAAWSETLLSLWGGLPLGFKLGLIGVALLAVGWGVVRLLINLGRRGRRGILLFGTGFSFVAAVVLAVVIFRLPEPVGTRFDVMPQVLRVCASVFATCFVVGGLALSIPLVLNRIEAGGAIGFVAARHVRATKSGFLTVISVLSTAGVAVSCLALVVVISVMGGFGSDLKRKILGNNAHISVDRDNVGGFGDWDRALDEVRSLPGVNKATPMVSGEAMASSSSNTAGVIVRGVDLDSVGEVTDLVKNVEVGDFGYLKNPSVLADLPAETIIGLGPGGVPYSKGPSLKKQLDVSDEVADILRPDDSFPGLIVGRELAKSLHVLVGDEVSLVAPLGDLGPMGVMPRTRRFRVAGIFYSGMYEYDASHVYVTLNVAQEFLDLEGKITSIEATVGDPDHVKPVRDRVAQVVAARELRVRDWQELNKNLFSALKLEKIATFVILSLAIIVACFCIICTLLLMVTEKSKEIAIIKALGASDSMVLRIFMAEGSVIGAMGTLFGVVTGWVMCEGLKRFGVRLDPDVYYVDRLPIEVNPVDYALVAVCALAITVLATLYPALSASRLRPVDGIRYE